MSSSAADTSDLTISRRPSQTPRFSSSASPSRDKIPSEAHTIPGECSSSNTCSDVQPAAFLTCVLDFSAPAPSSGTESCHERKTCDISNLLWSPGELADMRMGGVARKPSTFVGELEIAPRKKRSRTLFTPHQTDVLQALLAQSQFPTTQMREMVARSIGLSARKVQIWFQNQRQKLRHPPPTAPLTRRPRMRPFTTALSCSASDISSTSMATHWESNVEGSFPHAAGEISKIPCSSAGSSSCRPPEPFAPAHRDAYLGEEYRRSVLPPTQLTGPGVPGSSQRGLVDAPVWGRTSQGFPTPPSTSLTEPRETYGQTLRPNHVPSEQDFKLTLKLPLVATRARDPSLPSADGLYPVHSSLSALKSIALTHQKSSPEETHHNLPPVNVDFSTPRPPLNIPPPFTLQPQPLWDDPAFSPYNRRRSSLEQHTAHRRRPGGLRRLCAQPLPSISTIVPLALSGPSPVLSPLSPAHRTRFDPIRSTAGRTLEPRATQTSWPV